MEFPVIFLYEKVKPFFEASTFESAINLIIISFSKSVFLKNSAVLGLAHNPEHLGAALRTNAGHSSPLGPALAFHGDLFGAVHLPLGLALYAICCFCHIFKKSLI